MEYIHRFIEAKLKNMLQCMPVVAVTGPRQSGKSTLVRHIKDKELNKWQMRDLDQNEALAFAKEDPRGFLLSLGNHGIIDEIQRCPELFRAIKVSVGEARYQNMGSETPGMFIVTGSTEWSTREESNTALTGRMGTLPLYPLSVSELQGTKPDFLERIFQGEHPVSQNLVSEKDILEIIFRGGYPSATSWEDRSNQVLWQQQHLNSLIKQDFPAFTDLRKPEVLPKLLKYLANHSGEMVSLTNTGEALGMDWRTVDSYISTFESLGIVKRLKIWGQNSVNEVGAESKKSINWNRQSKLYFVDTGLLTCRSKLTPEKLQTQRDPLGGLLETFVFSELLKQVSWYQEEAVSDQDLFFWQKKTEKGKSRKDQECEVDFVLENRDGEIVGIEVKATHTPTRKHFAALEQLKNIAGDRMRSGVLLHLGESTDRFSRHPDFFTVPIGSLFG